MSQIETQEIRSPDSHEDLRQTKRLPTKFEASYCFLMSDHFDLLKAFQELSPQSRASLKASSWVLDGQVLDTTSTDPVTGGGQAGSLNKKVTIVGNGEEDSEGNVLLEDDGILLVRSRLITGDRSDTFVGVGELNGVYLIESALTTGNGNDTINGEGGVYGVSAKLSLIDMGNGNNSINGTGGSHGINLESSGLLLLAEDGNDSVNGTGGAVGVYLDRSNIQLGDGNNSIYGEGATGISLTRGFIRTGSGDDSITGVSTSDDAGISFTFSRNTIITGAGNDTVDALTGGFEGFGRIYLGADNDTLIGDGFSSGIRFDGDGFVRDGEVAGTKDKIVLGNGTYSYVDGQNGGSPYLVDGSGGRMIIRNFELISGISGTIDQNDDVNEMGAVALEFGNTYDVVNGFLIV